MGRECCNKNNSCRNTCCCNRCRNGCYNNCCYCNNGCEDFLLPVMFWMMRDMSRCCRCNWVNRYDRYRC